jgi:hypothetical protein
MLTAELKLKLEAAIETVLFMAPKGTPLMELAKRIYADERELISQVQESWILDRLVWMLSRRRQTIGSVDPQEAESHADSNAARVISGRATCKLAELSELCESSHNSVKSRRL